MSHKSYEHGVEKVCLHTQNMPDVMPVKGLVEKYNKRHNEERSDVTIALAFNIRGCHAVARDDENRTFSTCPGLITKKR